MAQRTETHPRPDDKAFRLAEWRVEPAALRISKDSITVKLEPRAMAVLAYLCARPNEVVSRQELESSIWNDAVVGYDALSNAINKLRKAFGDQARNPEIIETIPKTGFRLIAEVAPLGERPPTAVARASIAVLAFDNMSGDPDQKYFSDGISEDITTDLCKVPGLFVIARNSAFVYQGRAIEVTETSRELGVRYLLEGSVRKSGQRVRINAQLIDGTTGGHVWAERYDRDLTDIFSVQDEVTSDIVAAILPTLTDTDRENTRQRETPVFEAYDHFLRGREFALLDTETGMQQAESLLQRAIDLDPNFSSAHSCLARCYALNDINQWGKPEQRSLRRALELGRKAISLNGRNPQAHFSVGTTALWLKMFDLARAEISLSIELDPNYADGYAAMSMIQVYSGEPREALDSLATAMRLDPHYRDIYLHLLGQAHFHQGQYREAADALKRRLVRKPESDISRVLLASTYGQLGDFENSRIEWQAALRANPEYSIEQKRKMLPYQNPADFEQIVEGLARSGLLETS